MATHNVIKLHSSNEITVAQRVGRSSKKSTLMGRAELGIIKSHTYEKFTKNM